MDRRIIQYFAGQLSNEEQKSLLNEILENKELKAEMMQYRHLHTLINLQPGQADAQAGEESYHRFIARRQWQQKRHVLLVAMRYAAVLVIGVALTLWFNHALQHSASVEPQAEPMAQTLTVPPGQRAHITLPDGTKVCYFVCGRGCYVCDLKGNIVAELGKLHAAKWLDNNTIVAMNDTDNGVVITSSAIVAASLDGKRQTLTDAGMKAMYPYATADGKKVVFTTDEGETYMINIK